MFYKAKGTKTLYKKFIYAVATVAIVATVDVNIPDVVKVISEVTDDEEYKSSALAKINR